MRNLSLLAILLFLVEIGYAQEVIVGDSLSIELKKVKSVSKTFNARSSTKVKSDELDKVLTRCKIIALKKQDVDINAFSLVDTVNKIRYRIAEYIGYKGVSVMGSGYTAKMYLTKPLVNKRGRPYANLPKYDASLKDSFETFSFEGYKNIEVPINFGTKGKKLVSPVMYAPTGMRKFTAEIYFIVINNLKPPKLVLYYGKKIIGNVNY